MSYCRWSDNHGECDVYVYESSGGGYITHVAYKRFKHRVPDSIKNLFSDQISIIKDVRFYQKSMNKWLKTYPHTSHIYKIRSSTGDSFSEVEQVVNNDSEFIDLKEIGAEAGESLIDNSPGECANSLLKLREKGFLVPQHAIDALLEEQEYIDANRRTMDTKVL